MTGVDEIKIPVSMMGESEEVLDRYQELVASGKCAPKLAEILASRCCPAADTDTAHYSGQKSLFETAGPLYARKVLREAKRAGLNVSADTPFNGSFADARGGGDPRAWQMAGCGRDHFRKTCEERGDMSEDLGVTKMSDKRLEQNAKKQARLDKKKRNQ